MEKNQITQETIENWKKQYGSVYAIEVPLDDSGSKKVTGYFRKPDLKTIGAAARYSETDPVKAGLIVFENCWLGGDEELRNNDECIMSAIQSLSTLFVVRVSTIKNL